MAASHEVISCWTGRNARWKPQAHTKVVGLFGNGGALFAKVPFSTAWPAVVGEDPVWWLHMGYPELSGCLSPGLHSTGTAAAGNTAAACVPCTSA